MLIIIQVGKSQKVVTVHLGVTWLHEEASWTSDETFLQLKMLHPDEQKHLFGVKL